MRLCRWGWVEGPLLTVKGVTFRRGEERRVFRAPVTLLLLGMLAGPMDVSAQVESKTAAVTLVARVQESFALYHVPLPITEPVSSEAVSNPWGVQVVLGWRLIHGRSFQVGYELADESGLRPTTLASGVVVPSQIPAVPPIQSFLPTVPTHPGTMGGWGNSETDPSGVAGFFLLIPPSGPGQSPTLRLRAIIL